MPACPLRPLVPLYHCTIVLSTEYGVHRTACSSFAPTQHSAPATTFSATHGIALQHCTCISRSSCSLLPPSWPAQLPISLAPGPSQICCCPGLCSIVTPVRSASRRPGLACAEWCRLPLCHCHPAKALPGRHPAQPSAVAACLWPPPSFLILLAIQPST